VIIVEGPDGAGKSYLVEEICDQFGLMRGIKGSSANREAGVEPEGTRDRLWETTVDETYEALAMDVDPREPPLVWDRLFYSELVYAAVQNRPCAFGTQALDYVNLQLRAQHAVVIYCRPPLDTIELSIAADPDKQHDWVAGNVEKIVNRYDGLKWATGTYWHDWTGDRFNRTWTTRAQFVERESLFQVIQNHVILRGRMHRA
jgi:thymidylate kinase